MKISYERMGSLRYTLESKDCGWDDAGDEG